MAKSKGKGKRKTAKQKREDTIEALKERLSRAGSNDSIEAIGFIGLAVALKYGALGPLRELLSGKTGGYTSTGGGSAPTHPLQVILGYIIPGGESTTRKLKDFTWWNIPYAVAYQIGHEKDKSPEEKALEIEMLDWMVAIGTAYVIRNITKEVSISEISSIAAEALPL